MLNANEYTHISKVLPHPDWSYFIKIGSGIIRSKQDDKTMSCKWPRREEGFPKDFLINRYNLTSTLKPV